jgi:c-di-GMP-binding flagellar brake protein YcgR
MHERRKYKRVQVSVVASYECYDDDYQMIEQGIGFILDISLGGLLIESDIIIDANFIKVRYVNYDNSEKCIVASVVHSKKLENGKVRTGVCFHSSTDKNTKFVADMVRTHHYGYNKACYENAPVRF